jgi:hypothetical protein
MSTTTFTRPLQTVPDIPTTTKAKFAILLALRLKAQEAFDKAMSLPRSAIRWAVSLFQKWAEATASIGVFAWLGQQARNAAGLIRAAGIVPVTVAVLSTPPIAAAATRLARFVGNGVRKVASAAWSGLKGLLARGGATGARIAQGLTRAGAKVVDVVRAAVEHPVMVPVAHVLQATMAFVRPISQAFVAHRLLRLLVPILWLRTLIGFLVMPLLINTGLIQGVEDLVSTPPAEPTSNGNGSNAPSGNGTAHATSNDGSGARDVTLTGLLLDTFDAEVPMPTNGNVPTDGTDDDDPTLNRAARRAQQRQDAQAKRPRR